MRDWIHTQNPASFKGVSFEVDSDKVAGGRRIVTHEYPDSEFWDNEDLGRSKFPVTVDGFVFGDDADAQAQQLLAACSSPGAGMLVLPVRPPTSCVCVGIESTWQADAQGRIAIQMQFVAESRTGGGLVSTVDASGAMDYAADGSSDGLVGDFSETFDSLTFAELPGSWLIPSCAREAAAVTLGLAAAALAGVFAAVNIPDVQAAAKIAYSIGLIAKNALSYAEQGETPYAVDDALFVDDQTATQSAFARVYADTVKSLVVSADNAVDVVTAFGALTSFSPQPLSTGGLTCRSSLAESKLLDTAGAFIRRVALVRWAQALTKVKYSSRAEAVNARAKLAPAFQPEIDAAKNPEQGEALQLVRDAAANFLTLNGAQLPKTVTIETANGRPAAVLAAALYSDAGRDMELWVRAGMAFHPLQLPTSIVALAPTPQ